MQNKIFDQKSILNLDRITRINANYNMTLDDEIIICDNQAGTITVSLPDITILNNKNIKILIKRNYRQVIVSAFAGQKIDNNKLSEVLRYEGDSIILINNGIDSWETISYEHTYEVKFPTPLSISNTGSDLTGDIDNPFASIIGVFDWLNNIKILDQVTINVEPGVYLISTRDILNNPYGMMISIVGSIYNIPQLVTDVSPGPNPNEITITFDNDINASEVVSGYGLRIRNSNKDINSILEGSYKIKDIPTTNTILLDCPNMELPSLVYNYTNITVDIYQSTFNVFGINSIGIYLENCNLNKIQDLFFYGDTQDYSYGIGLRTSYIYRIQNVGVQNFQIGCNAEYASSHIIDDCTFNNCSLNGIYSDGRIYITNSVFNHNSTYGARCTTSDCIICNNSYGTSLVTSGDQCYNPTMFYNYTMFDIYSGLEAFYILDCGLLGNNTFMIDVYDNNQMRDDVVFKINNYTIPFYTKRYDDAYTNFVKNDVSSDTTLTEVIWDRYLCRYIWYKNNTANTATITFSQIGDTVILPNQEAFIKVDKLFSSTDKTSIDISSLNWNGVSIDVVFVNEQIIY